MTFIPSYISYVPLRLSFPVPVLPGLFPLPNLLHLGILTSIMSATFLRPN